MLLSDFILQLQDFLNKEGDVVVAKAETVPSSFPYVYAVDDEEIIAIDNTDRQYVIDEGIDCPRIILIK